DVFIGVIEQRENPALAAIRVGIVAEAGVPQRISVEAAAVFAVALFQHDHFTPPFPDACGSSRSRHASPRKLTPRLRQLLRERKPDAVNRRHAGSRDDAGSKCSHPCYVDSVGSFTCT